MNTSQQTPRRARTVTARSGFDVRSGALLAVLLAAGFILNFTVGRAVSGISGGLIAPEFVISAFCLAISIEKPSFAQAVIYGLIAAAVIQLTTTSPLIDFPAEALAALVMAALVRIPAPKHLGALVSGLATCITTAVSGVVFILIKVLVIGAAPQLALAMMPVVAITAVLNGVLVAALAQPISAALGRN